MKIEKYKFYYGENKVVAVSTYAGKKVRGVAKCSNEDSFDRVLGERLAALRCAQKVAKKRKDRAQRKFKEACDEVQRATSHVVAMDSYLCGAVKEYHEIEKELEDLLKEI